MFRAPRFQSTCSVGATTENGTDCMFSSRFRDVTVTVTSSVKRPAYLSFSV